MTEVEKEESQKTVVSFITGLLIGGLLVWIFSSTPEEKKEPEVKKETTEQVQTNTSGTKTEVSKTATEEIKVPVTNQKIEIGKGSVSVADQSAGLTVALGNITVPATSGWVVVRDDINGTPGNVLGAARFNADEGLAPSSIELIRKTEAGKSYRVMFYTQEGGLGFALGEDKPIEGASATFKAQ